MFEEKKTAVMHLRLPPSVARAARESALVDRRSIQDQLAVLIEESLRKRGNLINAQVAEFEQMELQKVAKPSPHVARRSAKLEKRA